MSHSSQSDSEVRGHNDKIPLTDILTSCQDTMEDAEDINKPLFTVLQEIIVILLEAIIDRIHETRFGSLLQKSRLYTHTTESVLAFDTFCRYFFPGMFFTANFVYWLFYIVI